MGKRIIIDVREPYEYLQDHVEGAINIPPAKLMSDPEELLDVPTDTEIILYCRSGSRSNVAMQYLRAMGFKNLTNGINKDHVEARFL